jgi:hypothetical protein
MIVLCEEISRSKDNNHNNKSGIFNVTKAVVSLSILMQTTKVRAANSFIRQTDRIATSMSITVSL